jgi:hypothetical protein
MLCFLLSTFTRKWNLNILVSKATATPCANPTIWRRNTWYGHIRVSRRRFRLDLPLLPLPLPLLLKKKRRVSSVTFQKRTSVLKLKWTDKEIYIEEECSRRTARLICNYELAGAVRKTDRTYGERTCPYGAGLHWRQRYSHSATECSVLYVAFLRTSCTRRTRLWTNLRDHRHLVNERHRVG